MPVPAGREAERAARLVGLTLSAFVRLAIAERATRVLDTDTPQAAA